MTVKQPLLTLFGAIAVCSITACKDVPRADPANAAQVASGKVVYEAHCATCHGADLQGQPDWKARNASGRMPAPPHDDSGHTWHHPDDVLFGITKGGIAPPYGPPGYQSDMPAFRATLTDREIWDVISYIKSRWSRRVREAQLQIDRQRQR